MSTLTSVNKYLNTVLVCISLIISDLEHLFMCFLVICISLEKYLFRSSIFWLGCVLFFFSIELHAACIFWRLISCQLYILQIFSPTLWAVLLFIVSFAMQKAFEFNYIPFVHFISLTWGDGQEKISCSSLFRCKVRLFEIFLVSWGKLLFLSVTLRTCFAVSHWFWINVLSFSFVCGYF